MNVKDMSVQGHLHCMNALFSTCTVNKLYSEESHKSLSCFLGFYFTQIGVDIRYTSIFNFEAAMGFLFGN